MLSTLLQVLFSTLYVVHAYQNGTARNGGNSLIDKNSYSANGKKSHLFKDLFLDKEA